jgi:AsmA family protein
MVPSRSSRLLAWIGIPILLLGVLAAVWNWDWFIPVVQSMASKSLGRPVTIGHLHVAPGRHITVTADDVVVANPPQWPEGDPPLARVQHLTIETALLLYLRGEGLVLPLIAVDHPVVYAAKQPDGTANFKISTGGGSGGTTPKIGKLEITDGTARVVIPKLKADFTANIATRNAQGASDEGEQIVADVKGTYAEQQIEAHMIGGALLSLRDKKTPWPIDLALVNGPTKLSLSGTLQDPVALAGANLTLKASGPDMGLLEQLTGFPIPKTLPYQIATKLDLQGLDRIRLTDMRGRMGESDIEGNLEVEPEAQAAEPGKKAKPVARADLRSARVKLTDFAGFLGATPGTSTSKNATPAQREAAAKASAGPKLLPDTPIKVPVLTWADVHLNYKGEHITGRSVPLDNVVVRMDLIDGRINIHPLSFAVGKGRLLANADVVPVSDSQVRAKADLKLENVDVSRLMAATHTFQGAGAISGIGAFEGTGNSVATLLGTGNGEVKMAMTGGDLSALMVDLSGLQFGKALLSALGVPEREQIECFVGVLALRRGLLDFQAMTLQTKDSLINLDGTISLVKEAIDLSLKTDARHFSVGSLPTRLNISGTFRHPDMVPGAQGVTRGGALAGLGVLFAPLALLPTVQFGTSAEEDARCGELLRQARASAGGAALPKR